MEEAFDGFTRHHAQLDRDQIQELSSQAFTWLTEGFAVFASHFSEDSDLDAMFSNFSERHQLSERVAQDLADYIKNVAGVEDDHDDDDDDAITFPDEAAEHEQEARVEKIKGFLRAIARAIGDNSQPLFPKLKVGDVADPYGNRAVGDVKPFDREANRYGHNADGGLQEGSSSMIQRVAACIDNHSKLWTASTCNESPGDGVRKAMKKNNNKDGN